MVSKILLALCVVVAVASAVPAGGAGWGAGGAGWGAGAGPWGAGAGAFGAGAGGVNPWIPPWVSGAPWFPAWKPCVGIGTTCVDCTTKLVCTKVGGLHRACTDPTLPYCNLGECSATPTTACAPAAAPVPVVPAIV